MVSQVAGRWRFHRIETPDELCSLLSFPGHVGVAELADALA